VGYLSVLRNNKRNFIDWKWLEKQSYIGFKYFRNIRCEEPFITKIDGRRGISIVYKNGRGINGCDN